MSKYRRWLPLRQALGKDRHGQMVAKEVYGDPTTGAVYEPRGPDGKPLGWQGAPPEAPSGAWEKEATQGINREAYRRGWETIFVKEPNDGKR